MRQTNNLPRWLVFLALLCVVSGIYLLRQRTTETTQPNTLSAADQAMQTGTILVPPGFKRPIAQNGSFGSFLRTLALKPTGQPVLLFNGQPKPNQAMVYRTVALPISKLDLHQCADAVIRLKALYEYKRKNYQAIRFHFTSGDLFTFDQYSVGWYPKINGSNVSFKKRKAPGKGTKAFNDYLRIIYTYAGTLSLDKEMQPISASQARPGDVFVQGGSPGHAVIIIDEALGPAGERRFLLAQSYMPAQELHVLKEPDSDSPWHKAPQAGQEFETREWTFPADSLKRFSL